MQVPDFSTEVRFSFSRSGGAGGQNVNKVETAVTGTWSPSNSVFFTEEEKNRMAAKLENKLNSEGNLVVRSQVHRSQGANRAEVLERMEKLIKHSLMVKKPRIATRPGKKASEKRLDLKKQRSLQKQSRGPVKIDF